VKLYHVSKSRSTRVLWLLEELGLDYELETLPFDPGALKSPDYLAINPFGKVPVLVDGPVTMSESVAIIQYLLDRYGEDRLQPDRESPEYARFLQWLHFGESTLMGPIAAVLANAHFLPQEERDPRAAERNRRTLKGYLEILDEELGRHAYLVGDEFTAADIVVGYAVLLLKLFRELPDGLPNLRAWFERLAERPAFKKATAA